MTEHMTSQHLYHLANEIDSGRVTQPISPVSLSRILPSDLVQDSARYLGELTKIGYSDKALANTLRLLARERETWKSLSTDSIDLVWTGPDAPGTYSRDTSVVVRELFQSAQTEVLISGYAVYQGLSVFKSLADQMKTNPNLKVDMYLDVKREYRDTTTENDAILNSFKDRFINNQWPGDKLPSVFYDPRSLSKDRSKRTALHAKCVVVDKKIAFVSSANFTEAAQRRNIEAGVLIRSPWVAEKLAKQFRALVESDLLKCLIS